MPIWEYKCHRCGFVKEKIQKVPKEPICESCGIAMTKQFPRSNFKIDMTKYNQFLSSTVPKE